MYLIDFFRKLFKSKNIGIIIWLFFNSLMFIIPFMSICPDYPILGLLFLIHTRDKEFYKYHMLYVVKVNYSYKWL